MSPACLNTHPSPALDPVLLQDGTRPGTGRTPGTYRARAG